MQVAEVNQYTGEFKNIEKKSRQWQYWKGIEEWQNVSRENRECIEEIWTF